MRLFVFICALISLAGTAVAQVEPVVDLNVAQLLGSESGHGDDPIIQPDEFAEPFLLYSTATENSAACQLNFDTLNEFIAEQKSSHKEQLDAEMRCRVLDGVYVDVINLGRSLPVAPVGVDAIQPTSDMSLKISADFDTWEAVWIGGSVFQGEAGGFVYESKFTSAELNLTQLEKTMCRGSFKCLLGARYIGLNDSVSCPPYIRTATNDLIGLQGVFGWKRSLTKRLSVQLRNTSGILANFVDRRHGDFFGDQQILASFETDVYAGVDFELWRGIHADVAYQGYYIANIQSAYSATPSFVEIHEGDVFIHGVGFGLSKQF